jgi:hypothetical protein
LPDALAQALEEQYLLEDESSHHNNVVVSKPMPQPHSGADNPPQVQADLCPGCGNTSLVAIEGCQSCYNCGHAEC